MHLQHFRTLLAGLAIASAAVSTSTWAQEGSGRKELKREPLSGAPHMEVVVSITEIKPGEELPLHVHHGIESIYVVQGATIQLPGKNPQMLPTGASLLNLRDVPHAGFKNVGDTILRLHTVHIVDRDKPMYDSPRTP